MNSDGCSGLIGQLFRATTLGSRLRVRRPRIIGQNIPIYDCFSSLFASVQVFIKEGCPCSLAAQPFFNLLFDAYGKHARFFGVFDGSVSKAKKWAMQNQAAFPLLSDPDLRTVHEYKAENSAYVALIAKVEMSAKY